jgi:hypothetical protein
MSKFSCFSFGNPTNKIVTRTAYTWGLLIANHLDQSLWSTNEKYWAAIRSNLVQSFLGGAQLCCTFHQSRQVARLWCKITNFLSWTGTFWLFNNKFYFLESHTEHRWRGSNKTVTESNPAFWEFRYLSWAYPLGNFLTCHELTYGGISLLVMSLPIGE